jgi:hypothetical protein
VTVDVDGRDQLAGPEGRVREARATLERSPAIVRERADLGTRAVVDLLPRVLADVRELQVAVRAIEREPPWIP